MPKHRPSLADFAAEDARVTKAPAAPQTTAETVVPLATSGNQNSEKRNPKSDFIKVSVTLPPELFERIQDVSRERRRAKEPYAVSALAREAFESWLAQR